MSEIKPSTGGNIDTNAILMKINMLSEEIKMKADRTDLDKLKLEMRKYTDAQCSEVERALEEKHKNLKELFDNLKMELARLRAEFDQHKNKDFVILEQRVTALEKRIAQILQQIASLGSGGHAPVSSGIDAGALAEIERRLADLEDKFNQLQDLFARWMKDMQDALNNKADISALNELEKLLQDRLNEIVKALTKQFADKAETKKALKLHERQLKNLYSLMMSKGGGDHDEDAMFSKKPLGGLSCASCEKDLVNMMGKKVEFMPWNKLPFRDPAERIARVGQGFSKMLSMINPDQLSRYEQVHSQMQQSAMDPHQVDNPFNENYNAMGHDMQGGKTHTKFPNANQPRFVTSDGKRPGSANNRKNKLPSMPRVKK